MPLVKYLKRHSPSEHRSLESSDDSNRNTMMSKTMQFDDLLNEDENYMHQKKNFANDDLDNYEIHFAKPNTMKGLERFNEFYIKPLLIRKASLKPTDEQDIQHHDRRPLLSSNGNKSSFMNDDDDDNDEDGEDDLLVVNQLRQENFQLKTIKDTKRTNIVSHDT